MKTSTTGGELVSIVIPVFNGARMVGEAIESALAQSWPFVEVIVVDDGSSDGGATQRVLAGFGDAIRVVTKPNGGVATALNAGIAAMRGDWFSWLSHDDVYHPMKVERYLASLQTVPGPAVAFGDVDLVNEDGSLLSRRELTKGFEGDDGRWAALEGRLNGCAMLVPRACLEACGAFDPRLPTTQDYALWFRMGQRYPFIPVKEALVRSRVHAEQGSRTARHLEEASLLWIWMLDELETDEEQTSHEIRLRRLLRVLRFLRTSAYAGARAHVEGRLDQILAEYRVSSVLVARRWADVEAAVSTLAAARVKPGALAVLDGTSDAAASMELAEDLRSREATLFRLASPGSEIDLSVLLQVASTLHGVATAFLDPAALPGTGALREALITVLAGEADGCLSTAVPPNFSLPVELSGSVLRGDAIRAAAGDSGSPAMAALLREAKLVTTVAPPSVPTPRPPRRAAPRVPLASGARPALSNPPRAGRPTLLMLLHAWGGGTARYAATLAASIGSRASVLFAWGVDNQRFFLSSLDPESAEWEYDLANGLGPLLLVLRELGVTRLDILHDIGFSDWTDDFLDQLGAPFDVTFLDYHLVANTPHLTDASGYFVGDAALLQANHHARRITPPRLVVRAAQRRIACSRDLAARIRRLVPGLSVLAARLPEPGNPNGFATYVPPLADDEVMRVLYLSRIARHKGMDRVAEVARVANERGIRLCVYCLGADHEFPDAIQQQNGLHLLGSYHQEDLNTLICRLRPHLAWLPFTAPETHSFSLSDAMLQGLPILATGIGAVPERVQGRPSTWLLTPAEATVDGFVEWFARLRRDRFGTKPRWLPTDHLPPLAELFYERDYLRPLFRGADT